MYCNQTHFQGIPFFTSVMSRRPDAVAHVKGSYEYPEVQGCVQFYQTRYGMLVAVEVFGLPQEAGYCNDSIFALHIHEGSECAGNCIDPLGQAMGHYNPHNCLHPHHAGDLPPLFGNNGYAFFVFLTDKFYTEEILGRTVIIHDLPDDFTTQPSGNSGARIACGQIKRT